MDVLGGMQNGPRGNRGGGGLFGGGGISPIAGAVLGLLAYKAFKSFSSSQPAQAGGGQGAGQSPGQNPGQSPGLGDMLRNGLDSVLGGGNAGGAMSGGLGDLLRQFQGAGKGDVADSWIAKGANAAIPARELEQVLTPEQIAFLTERTGLSRDELMSGLAEQLPKAIDYLTPEGRLPTDKELGKLI